MNVQEMHIGIDLLLQEVNSNIISGIKPEEKDKFLNEEVIRYVNQITRKGGNPKKLGLQDDVKRYEDMKALLETKNLSVYYRDDRSVFTYLPSNCLRLLNDRSLTKNLCGFSYNPTTTNTFINYSILPLPSVSSINNYSTYTVEINSVVVFNINNYPQFAGGISTNQERFQLIDFILEAIRLAGYEAKYENFLDVFSLGNIIVSLNSNFTLTWYYDTVVGIVVTTNEEILTILQKPVVKISDTISMIERANGLTKTEEIYTLLQTSFGTTRHDFPLSTLERGRLNIYHDKKFIVSSVNVDYIRFPRKISLPLNQSCDLDESVHQEIVDNVAKRLAATTSSQNYNLLTQENNLKE